LDKTKDSADQMFQSTQSDTISILTINNTFDAINDIYIKQRVRNTVDFYDKVQISLLRIQEFYISADIATRNLIIHRITNDLLENEKKYRLSLLVHTEDIEGFSSLPLVVTVFNFFSFIFKTLLDTTTHRYNDRCLSELKRQFIIIKQLCVFSPETRKSIIRSGDICRFALKMMDQLHALRSATQNSNWNDLDKQTCWILLEILYDKYNIMLYQKVNDGTTSRLSNYQYIVNLSLKIILCNDTIQQVYNTAVIIFGVCIMRDIDVLRCIDSVKLKRVGLQLIANSDQLLIHLEQSKINDRCIFVSMIEIYILLTHFKALSSSLDDDFFYRLKCWLINTMIQSNTVHSIRVLCNVLCRYVNIKPLPIHSSVYTESTDCNLTETNYDTMIKFVDAILLSTNVVSYI